MSDREENECDSPIPLSKERSSHIQIELHTSPPRSGPCGGHRHRQTQLCSKQRAVLCKVHHHPVNWTSAKCDPIRSWCYPRPVNEVIYRPSQTTFVCQTNEDICRPIWWWWANEFAREKSIQVKEKIREDSLPSITGIVLGIKVINLLPLKSKANYNVRKEKGEFTTVDNIFSSHSCNWSTNWKTRKQKQLNFKFKVLSQNSDEC